MNSQTMLYRGYRIRTDRCGEVEILSYPELELVDAGFDDVDHAKVYIDQLYNPPQTMNNSGVPGCI